MSDVQKDTLFFSGDLRSSNGLCRLVFYQTKKICEKDNDFFLICKGAADSDFPGLKNRLVQIDPTPIKRFLAFTPLRWDYQKMMFWEWNIFDLLAIRYVKKETAVVYAIQRQAAHIVKRAEKVGARRILITHTPHIDFVWQIHREEKRTLSYNYEWLNNLIKDRKNLKIQYGDPRPAFEQTSILVHPSLQYSFGFTVAEALVCGLPVIVSENTEAKQLIKAGENDFIVSIKDIEARGCPNYNFLSLLCN